MDPFHWGIFFLGQPVGLHEPVDRRALAVPGINDGQWGFIWVKFMKEGLRAGFAVGCCCCGGISKYVDWCFMGVHA